MSTNFFAALDDSEDESPGPSTRKQAVAAAVTATTKTTEPKKDYPSDIGGRNKPGAGRRNDRRGGRGRPTARDGKRTYDRRSGTGRGREIKKGGGGARNWGSDKADARKAEGALNEDDVDEENATTPKGTVNPDEGEGAGPDNSSGKNYNHQEGNEEPAEPEVKTRTLDEYLADKQEKVKDSPFFQPTVKKSVENEFSGFKAKEAVEEDFLVMGSGKSLRKKGATNAQDETKKQNSSEKVKLGFRVGSKPGRGGRGDRGDNRRSGGRGRGNRRGGGSSGAAVTNALDPSAFPSL